MMLGRCGLSNHAVITEIIRADRHLRLLQDADAGTHGDAHLVQPLLRQIGQFDHSHFLLVEQRCVFLVAEFFEEDPQEWGFVTEKTGQFFDAGRIGEGGYGALPAGVAIDAVPARQLVTVSVRIGRTAAQRIGAQLRYFTSYRLHLLQNVQPKSCHYSDLFYLVLIIRLYFFLCKKRLKSILHF